MFDISAKLVSEQDEIYGVKTIDWEDIHGSICLWLVMNQVINHQSSAHKRLRLFRFCVVSWEDTREPTIKHCMGRQIGVVQKFTGIQRHGQNRWWVQWNSSVNIFPGFNTLQLSQEVKSLLLRLGETPEKFTGRIIFMSMFNDISCGSRDNEKECESNARLVSLYAKRFGTGQWSFVGPGSEKKWSSISADIPQGQWDRIAEQDDVRIWRKQTSSLPCHESIVQSSAQRLWKTVDALLCRFGHD